MRPRAPGDGLKAEWLQVPPPLMGVLILSEVEGGVRGRVRNLMHLPETFRFGYYFPAT